LKTRSSSGVGQKVDLEFDVDTLRIKDLGEEEAETTMSQHRNAASSALINGLKKTSVVTSTNVNPETGEIDPNAGIGVGKIKAETNSSRIRDMLKSLNSEKD